LLPLSDPPRGFHSLTNGLRVGVGRDTQALLHACLRITQLKSLPDSLLSMNNCLLPVVSVGGNPTCLFLQTDHQLWRPLMTQIDRLAESTKSPPPDGAESRRAWPGWHSGAARNDQGALREAVACGCPDHPRRWRSCEVARLVAPGQFLNRRTALTASGPFTFHGKAFSSIT
jgi:hypothetical protein